MAYEMRPSSGSLFKNNEMRPDKKDPNLKGKIMLPDGSTHWISGWTKQTNAGEKWISLQIGNPVQGAGKPASVPPLDAHNAAKGNAFVADDDSDIPF
jgi:hypothetical protein